MLGHAQIRDVADRPASGELHRLPARHTEPPFDDTAEAPPAIGLAGRTHLQPVQGALALAFALPNGAPAVPATPARPNAPDGGRRLHLVPAPPAQAATAQAATAQATAQATAHGAGVRRSVADDRFGPQPTQRALLPEPTAWAGRLVQAVVEVTVGIRPIAQLLRWTTIEVYESVRCRIAHAGAVASATRRTAPRVRSVHVDEPRDGVAEVCAVVQQGPRCRAVALRLEGLDGRWQCTALQVC